MHCYKMNTVIKLSSYHLEFALSKLISDTLSFVNSLEVFVPTWPLEGTADKRVSAAAAAVVWHPRKKADKDKTTDSCSR